MTIPNGADFDDVAGLERRPSDRFRITHTGSFFGRRDPRPFLQALHDSELDVVARFLGDFRETDRDWAAGLGLGDRLELLPYAPRVRVARAAAGLGGAPPADPRGRRPGQGRPLGEGVRVRRGRAADPRRRPARRSRGRADPGDRGGRRRPARRPGRDPRGARGAPRAVASTASFPTSSCQPSGATGSPAGRASRRWRPSSAIPRLIDGALRRWLSAHLAARVAGRRVLRRRSCSWRSSWLYPRRVRATRTSRARERAARLLDREFGGGNSVLPAQGIAIEARGRIPEHATRSPSRSASRQPDWTDLADPASLENYMRYFLLPRRADPGRAVDPLLRLRPERVPGRGGGLGGSERRPRDPEATVVTVRALAGSRR